MKNRFFERILLTGLTVILIFTPLARGAVRTWSITPVLFIVYFLAFLWFLGLNNNPLPATGKPRRTPLDRPIAIFVTLAVMSSIFSIYKYASFSALLVLFGYALIYYLIVNNFSRFMRRYLIALAICVGAGLSIYGLLQYFGFLPRPWWKPMNFLASTYVNHNHFAGYLELAIPVTIGALIRYNKIHDAVKSLLGLALAVMAAVFVFTQSRGAWISLFVSLILMDAVLIKRKVVTKKSMVILIVLVAAIFTFAYFKSDLVSKRINTLAGISEEEEASPRTRLKIWQGTLDMIRHNPLTGTGIGTYVWGFSRYRPAGLNVRAHYAHDDYLHMAAEMGLPALAVMLWLIALAIAPGFREKGAHPVMLGCATGMLSLALHGVIDFNFHIPANMILFITYAAILEGYRERRDRPITHG